MLHTSMRDAGQREIPVKLLHAQYVDMMGERLHIIGVIDQSSVEEGHPAQPWEVGAAAPAGIHASMAPVSESSLSRSDVGPEVLPQVLDGVPGEAAIWIDPHKEGLPMIQRTATLFAKLGGPSCGASLRSELMCSRP